jgi:glycolate oxidase FAD binding subunit
LPSVSSLAEAADLFATANTEGRRVHIDEELTEGLDRILEYEPGDLTCVVEAGVRLSALRATLAEHGQRLSLDPPGDPTIGACLAANLSGPLRHRFGAPRDLVLGVTLVLADGTIANAGGKVVKNVAGYDLGKLVCGSRGTLGLIARVSLRLHPLPGAARTLVVETAGAATVAGQLLRSQLEPSALDVLHPGRVAVMVEGGETAVAWQFGAGRALVGGDEDEGSVWDEARSRQGAARGRLFFAPDEFASLLTGLDEAILRPTAGVAYVDHEVETEVPEALRRLHERIRLAFDPNGVLRPAT